MASFSDAVKKYGSTTAAFQALGYTKNDNGSWTKSGSTNAATNATSTGGVSSSGGSGNKTNTSASAQASTAVGRNVGENGYDPNLDYSAAIEAAKDAGADASYIEQLNRERDAKIAHKYGGTEPVMYGSNQTYKQLSGAASSGNTAAQGAINSAIQFNANNGSQYMGDNAIYKAAYEAAAAGDWDRAGALVNQLAVKTDRLDEAGNPEYDLAEANRYMNQLSKLFNYDANAYYQQKYDAVYGAGAWDGGTGTGKPVHNDYSKALVDYYNQNNGQQMVTPDQLNLILGGGASSSGGPGGSGAPNLSTISPAGNAGSLINGNGTSANVGNAYNPGGLGDYLDQWLQNAQQQQVNKIDYGTNQAVLDLIRQQQDAQGVYQEQRNQIAIDEAKAKDNQALYAEARGDKGGIGQAQYDQIMATAAQNRLQVSQAQTKLATDTARQIADLRAQGEYEKADALLQLSQQYLSQLINLEQWSMEYNLSVAQFNASLQQWAAEYEMAVADITGNFRGTPTLKYQQYQDELALTQQNQMASAGETLLSAGIMPSASQLAAMGITQEQAQSYITAAQLAAAQKAKSGGSNPSTTPTGGITANLGTKDWYAQIGDAANAAGQSVDDYLYQHRSDLGLTVEGVKTYLEGYNNWYDGGMTPDHFKASMNSLSSQLQAGALDGALANADRMWPDLGGDQRQQLQKLLATHGLAYNP